MSHDREQRRRLGELEAHRWRSERTRSVRRSGRRPRRRAGDGPGDDAGPPHLADPRALTILTTEHWSLLTARSLVYNEAFARGGMFLTFLTGTLVALGFVSQGSGFATGFLVVDDACCSRSSS